MRLRLLAGLSVYAADFPKQVMYEASLLFARGIRVLNVVDCAIW